MATTKKTTVRALGGSTRLLTMPEVADHLRIPLSTLWKTYRSLGIPARKVGRHVRVMQRELDSWIENQPRVS
jgi:excisionase family DNA binding protein